MKSDIVTNRIKTFFSSSRLTVTLWYAMLFLFLEILIGALIYAYMYDRLNERLDRALTIQADNILKKLSGSGYHFEKYKPDSVFRAPDEIVWYLIYDAVTMSSRNTFIQVTFNNKVIYHSQNLSRTSLNYERNSKNDTEIIRFWDGRISPHEIHAALAHKKPFEVVVAFPVENVTATLEYLRSIFLYLFPVFFFVALIGGAIISDKALSRFDRIIRLTDEITAHNLQNKIEGEDYRDEYGRLVKTLNRLISRIHAAFEYLNRFSISASHELRTPLTILRGEIEVALKSDNSVEQFRATLQSNYEETLRLIHIVENIFYISRLDRSLIQFFINPEKLNPFLTGIIQSAKNLGKEKAMVISFHLDNDIVVWIDKAQIKQAILNIIDNGFKYGIRASSLIIRTKVESHENTVIIDFINRGPAIPTDECEKIFEPFYRAEKVPEMNVQGAGLGLSVVRAIIRKHHGEIVAFSTPDDYTTFRIVLPIRRVDAL